VNQHRVLILGSLGEFVQLVQKAKARGYYTIVCDGYEDGPARKFCDEDFVIPVTDIDKIAHLCKEKNVDGIITSFSDLLAECMVKIADKANLSCYLKPDQLKYYRDKSATRELLKKLNLPTPGFKKINKQDQITPEMISELSFPLITKPMDKYGSRGIYVANNIDELNEFAKKTAKYTDLCEILVEEYNPGYEFNMMTYVLDGKVNIISIADREKTQIAHGEIPISTRNVYPSRLLNHVAAPAKELLQKYIEATGQTDGALSMQFFWNPGKGIQVCEIAARYFGYEHELTDMVFGFNMEDLLLNYLYDREALNKMLHEHKYDKPKSYGAVLYFQGKLMTIANQRRTFELAKHPAVCKPWIFYNEGETIIEHGPNPYAALYYIEAPSRKELDEITDYFYDNISITTSDGEEILYKNKIPSYPE
jgi:carbamoylphosphate synthase large subunit